MRNRSLSPRRAALRLAAVLVLSASISACADGADPLAGIPRGAADGLYPQVIVAGPNAAVTEVRISLLRKPAGTLLGSYQGELSFDASALRVQAATLPSGIDGVAELSAPGHLRFVGTALDGVGEVPLVTVRFERIGQVRPESFGVLMEEVTASDLSDVTAQVFSGAPLVGIVNH
jgi:hypothetical protein